MSDISAALVKELRERTGSGMMECKKALVATGGDIEKAIDEMRKSGLAKADKKAGRIAAEGTIVIKLTPDFKKALMLEVNCETDFVARDSNFLHFANQVAELALAQGLEEADAILAAKMGSATVDEARRELVQKIGENITVRRAKLLNTDGMIGTYVHGGRIGVLVENTGGTVEFAKDLAMHVAASSPMVVDPNDVPAKVVEKEKEIFIAQSKDSGKPMDIIEKMIVGQIFTKLS